MRYLCLAYGDESKMKGLSQSETDALVSELAVYDEELRKSGHLISGTSLGWGATTLRLRNGKLAITDGPFAATKEVVGGLVVIDAKDLNEAIQVASLHPAARMGEHLGWGLEVRPVEEHPPCRPQPANGG